jgi:fido (protein-threonine AMPylation protein)
LPRQYLPLFGRRGSDAYLAATQGNGPSIRYRLSSQAQVTMPLDLNTFQAFTEGNKRTARIISNGILIANGYCPISFRTVDSIDYKKAMLMFYEQNNMAAFKQIFIEQF